MKRTVKYLILFGLVMAEISTFAQLKTKYKIQLLDNDGNSVEFFLLGNKETLLKSNSDGELQLTKNQIKKYKSEKFTLHFSNHLAYLVYRINLYYSKGSKANDKHIKYNQIGIEDLVAEDENIFYLRRKEIRLDDEQGDM